MIGFSFLLSSGHLCFVFGLELVGWRGLKKFWSCERLYLFLFFHFEPWVLCYWETEQEKGVWVNRTHVLIQLERVCKVLDKQKWHSLLIAFISHI